MDSSKNLIDDIEMSEMEKGEKNVVLRLEKPMTMKKIKHTTSNHKKLKKITIDQKGKVKLDVQELELDLPGDEDMNSEEKKETYISLRNKINYLYYDSNEYYSSAMDILASYVKGQKLIYMESKHYCETRLDRLMLPAIFLSATASVCSSALDMYYWDSLAISILNAFISFYWLL